MHKEVSIITNLYEMLNDSSIDRVMAIDQQWCVIAWNKTSTDVTGINKDDIVGRPLLEVFPALQEDQEMIKAIQLAMQGNKTFLPARDGLLNRQYYENHFIPLKDNGGGVKGVMNIMHDVAHREKAENKLKELNAALDQKYRQLETVSTEMATFTYITSNEIKKPLRNVYTSFELLVRSEGNSLSNGSKANIRRMQASLNRMNLLLDDIWALAHINSFQQVRQQVDLNEVLRNALNKLQNKITEKQAVIQADQLITIPGFKEMLETFFVNLIDNSLKFKEPATPPRISITSQLVQPDALPAGFKYKNKPMLLLSIADNGIGFDPVHTDRIFIMFEKLHLPNEYHGSGMGLTIAKKITDAHDGFITAISKPGQGTTIQSYFPAVD
jgi:PAS domain S-box-containing protein